MSQEVRRRRRPQSCQRLSDRDARRAVGAVAFVRQRLEDLGYATILPDVFWCPAHDGHAPALRVKPASSHRDRGLASLVCAAGCAPVDILRALSLQVMRATDPDLPPHLYVVLPLAIA